jgi:pyruvate formate lyase activating enzyme
MVRLPNHTGEDFHEPTTEACSVLEKNESQVAQRAVCRICPRSCVLPEGHTGFCLGRRALGGRVIDENYGRIVALGLEPIEKKPFAEFFPGKRILSVGSYGCNMRCPYCQNALIACRGAEETSWKTVTPQGLVKLALSLQSQGNIGVAFTYNEPLIGYEFVLDTCKELHKQGLQTVLVTNGSINEEPLRELAEHLDAINIDLKGFTQEVYDYVEGDLEVVKRTIKVVAGLPHCHLEVKTVVVPGLTDDVAQIEALAQWLGCVNPRIPYHLARFYPCHQLTDRPSTPLEKVEELKTHAQKYLQRVYVNSL